MPSTASKSKPREGLSSPKRPHSSTLPGDLTTADENPETPPKRKKMARTRTGCLNCRRRKRKCDEVHPTCTACTRRGEYCEWGVKLTFRPEHAWSLQNDHPSMLRASKRPRNYEILDVRDEVIRDYNLHLPSIDHDTDEDTDGEGPSSLTFVHSPLSQESALAKSESPMNTRKRPFAERDVSPIQSAQKTTTIAEPTGTTETHLPAVVPRRPSRGPRSPNPSCPLLNADPPYLTPATKSPVVRPSSVYYAPAIGIPSPETTDHSDHKSSDHRTGSFRHDVTMLDPSHHPYPRTESHASTHKSPAQDVTETAVENLLFLSRGGPSPPTSNVAHSTSTHSEHRPARSVAADGSMASRLLTMNLDSGSSRAVHSISDTIHQQQSFTTEDYRDDGLFVPGSTYLEFHRLLRNSLFRESRTRMGRATSGSPTVRKKLPSGPGEQPRTHEHRMPDAQDLMAPAPEPFEMSDQDECAMWTNWVREVAPWLDKFDASQSFRNHLPSLSKKHSHLRHAMLAVSAVQMEKTGQARVPLSGALYQRAVDELSRALQTRTTAVLASSVILSVFEMMTCNPKLWRRHMDGCASLLVAVGINGFVGGLEQALFWTFARLDVSGGLISSERTLIPVSWWASQIDMDTDVALFRNAVSTRGFQEWANYAVHLVAQVQDLLAPENSSSVPAAANAGVDPLEPCFGDGAPRNDEDFRTRWAALWKNVEDWHATRPDELRQIMCIPSSDSSPFPTILYSNAAAISGNQLFHTAALLMLQHKPVGVRLPSKSRSALWHARQICGVAVSNECHGAWMDSTQPLWIAGRSMSHPAEHEVILGLLGRVERECGWSTEWRGRDLRETWGDLTE